MKYLRALFAKYLQCDIPLHFFCFTCLIIVCLKMHPFRSLQWHCIGYFLITQSCQAAISSNKCNKSGKISNICLTFSQCFKNIKLKHTNINLILLIKRQIINQISIHFTPRACDFNPLIKFSSDKFLNIKVKDRMHSCVVGFDNNMLIKANSMNNKVQRQKSPLEQRNCTTDKSFRYFGESSCVYPSGFPCAFIYNSTLKA